MQQLMGENLKVKMMIEAMQCEFNSGSILKSYLPKIRYWSHHSVFPLDNGGP